MNAYSHARISVKHWGGCISDYYEIHDFIDSTKELCSDSRHRILHTLWGVRRVIVPIFGHTITNSDGKEVDVKDMCERDHLLPDYHYKFIPTLSDFVNLINIDAIPKWKERVNNLHKQYAANAQMSELLLSPLANTGKAESLLLTHNSWFINEILPKILGRIPNISSFDIAPCEFFNAMNFDLWLNNGAAMPPSTRNIQNIRVVFADAL